MRQMKDIRRHSRRRASDKNADDNQASARQRRVSLTQLLRNDKKRGEEKNCAKAPTRERRGRNRRNSIYPGNRPSRRSPGENPSNVEESEEPAASYRVELSM